MQYCNNCHVYLRGENDKCILCGNTLSNSTLICEREEIFPQIPPSYEKHLAIRILIFVSFTIVVASFAIRLIFPTNINWPIFVIFGLLSLWLSLIIILRKRHDIPKTIMWQVTIVSLLSFFWDWQTGWIGWSLDYVIPIICMTAILIMYLTAKIMNLSIRDYLIYALLDCILGIIPILFILFDWVNNVYASIICVTISIVFLAAIFIFEGDNIRNELSKKMHL